MSAIFTQHAIDRMQERGVKWDVDRLLGILDSIAEAPGRLESSPDVTLVRHSGDGAMYLVRAGSLRAVLITNTGKDGIVVASVYWPDEEEIAESLSGPHEAPVTARAG